LGTNLIVLQMISFIVRDMVMQQTPHDLWPTVSQSTNGIIGRCRFGGWMDVLAIIL